MKHPSVVIVHPRPLLGRRYRPRWVYLLVDLAVYVAMFMLGAVFAHFFPLP